MPGTIATNGSKQAGDSPFASLLAKWLADSSDQTKWAILQAVMQRVKKEAAVGDAITTPLRAYAGALGESAQAGVQGIQRWRTGQATP